VRGDGGLSSTARDYGTFLQLFLNGGRLGATRLVSEASVRMMTSNQIGGLFVEQQPSANPAIAMPFPLGAGKDKFGLGFQIESAPLADRGLRSVRSYSWGGINNTHFWADPQKAIAAVVLMQVLPFYDESCIRVLRGFERIAYKELR
jgi:CubicO group peptidase (beta-lactamase class C family)